MNPACTADATGGPPPGPWLAPDRALAGSRRDAPPTISRGGAEAPATNPWEAARLARALAALPPDCRIVLLLRKQEMLSHEQIAARLAVPVGTVVAWHARGLRLLHAGLARKIEAEARPPAAAGGR